MVRDFETEFDVSSVISQIKEYVNKGQKELIAIHEIDSNPVKQNIIFFTNRYALDMWFNTERSVKILLSTAGSSPEGTFLKLFDLSRPLKALGIEVGIALPSISTTFSLSIKIRQISKTIHQKILIECWQYSEWPSVTALQSRHCFTHWTHRF